MNLQQNLHEQIRKHKEISLKIEELEEHKKALGQLIMQAMHGKALTIGNFLVKRHSRVCISIKVDEARHYDAVKMEEAVDKDKIKALFNSGVAIPGVKESTYIVVSYTQLPVD